MTTRTDKHLTVIIFHNANFDSFSCHNQKTTGVIGYRSKRIGIPLSLFDIFTSEYFFWHRFTATPSTLFILLRKGFQSNRKAIHAIKNFLSGFLKKPIWTGDSIAKIALNTFEIRRKFFVIKYLIITTFQYFSIPSFKISGYGKR